jgi:hypothetical protein
VGEVSDRRRRIDIVLEPEYLEGLESADLAEVRDRRDTAEDVEAQISYYRRLIHGRMDLLAFELKRRRGEEERSLIEALPEILSSGLVLGDVPSPKHLDVMPPLPSTTGRRLIDKIMEDGIITQLPDLADDEVAEALERLSEVEGALSAQRRQLHNVIDRLQAEIVARFRSQEDEARV